MSPLFDNWLASRQSLPIEGVGCLLWKRTAASRLGKTSKLSPPTWELVFEDDVHTSLPADFLDRLSRFANKPLPEVETQYRAWLRSFQAPSFRVTIFGKGELAKDSTGRLEWTNPAFAPLPTASLKSIPFSVNYLYRRWNFSNWLAVVLATIGLAWVLFLFWQNGFRVETGSSELPTPKMTQEFTPQPYQEIR